MWVRLYAGNCEGGPCPTVYQTEDGNFGVQGKRLTDPEALAQLEGMPDDETVVVIPRELLVDAARRMEEDSG